MVEFWAVMGRVMLEGAVLEELLGVGHSGRIVRSEADLHSFMIRKGNRLSRFEVGELYYWLSDPLFVEIVGDLAAAWKYYKPAAKKFDDDFYASVALTLFDKPFRDAIIAARSDEDQTGGRAGLAKDNLRSFNFSLQQSDINVLADFLTDAEVASQSVKKVRPAKKQGTSKAVEKSPDEKPSVQKSFRILEGLGWSPVCFERLSFDKRYRHIHPNSRFMAYYDT